MPVLGRNERQGPRTDLPVVRIDGSHVHRPLSRDTASRPQLGTKGEKYVFGRGYICTGAS